MDKCNCSMSIRLLGDGCRHCQPQEYIDRLGEWLEDERVERAKAEAEAGTLATSIWEQFYKEDAPDWGLCDYVAGMISQIDNMFAGVRGQLAQAKATIESDNKEFNELLSIAIRDRDHFIDELEETKATIEGLLKYASHQNDSGHFCDCLKHSDYPCDCGLDAVLNQSKGADNG